MTILFLCSSLEPGRDGVGDYTRRLAEECRRLGNTCAVIALHDRHLQSISNLTTEEMPELRLPNGLSWPKRILHAAAFREKFNPDWISLQFVPYGFDDRGLVWNLATHLRPIIGPLPLHIMFHELWIGAHQGTSLKERMVGGVQRRLILRMICQLQPTAVSTNNGTYIALLKESGVSASHLPLFGNVPIVEKPAQEWIYSRCVAEGLGLTPDNRSDFWIIGMFAALHSVWPPEPLFTLLSRAAAACGKRLIIASAGRLGSGGEHLWRQLTETYGEQLGFLRLDEQSVECLSAYLQWIDWGIATSPWQLIGKSGSVAAMLEHGLPVIVNRDDVRFRTFSDGPSDPMLMRCDQRLEALLLIGVRKGPRQSRRENIARKFVASLQRPGRATSMPDTQ